MKIGTDVYFSSIIQPYDFARLCFMITDDEGMKHYVEALGETYEEEKAVHIWQAVNGWLHMNVIVTKAHLKWPFIIHELEHCKNKVLLAAGKRADRDDDEADAYLIDYLARIVQRGLKKNNIEVIS